MVIPHSGQRFQETHLEPTSSEGSAPSVSLNFTCSCLCLYSALGTHRATGQENRKLMSCRLLVNGTFSRWLVQWDISFLPCLPPSWVLSIQFHQGATIHDEWVMKMLSTFLWPLCLFPNLEFLVRSESVSAWPLLSLCFQVSTSHHSTHLSITVKFVLDILKDITQIVPSLI